MASITAVLRSFPAIAAVVRTFDPCIHSCPSVNVDRLSCIVYIVLLRSFSVKNMFFLYSLLSFSPQFQFGASPWTYCGLLSVVVVVVVLINSHNQVRGRRIGSSHSGAEEYPLREKRQINQRWSTHIIKIKIHSSCEIEYFLSKLIFASCV